MGEWISHNLGKLIKVQNGYAFKSKDFDDFNGIPVIKIKSVASGELRMDDIKYYPHKIEGLERFVISKNDILIALTGSHVNQPSSIVGKVARYTKDEISLLNQRVGKISYGTLFTEYTYSDISIDIIMQILQEESCFLSVNICNPPFYMLRMYEKLASENFGFPYFLIRQEKIPFT